MPRTLHRYFGKRFAMSTLAVFAGVFVLVALIDYVEMMRRASGLTEVPPSVVAAASFFRVPQTTERLMPFAVLVGAMACYLTLSRRLELVIARSAGISAWQFVSPAIVVALLFGLVATMVYNPLSALLREQSKRLEAEMFGEPRSKVQDQAAGFWLRQRSDDGQAILYAATSREQGLRLAGVTVFTFGPSGQFRERIEAKSADLQEGRWMLAEARIYAPGRPIREESSYSLATTLSHNQVLESFSTPDTVPFWRLPTYIDLAERAGVAAAGYKLQFQSLLARPFLFAAMVLLAASVSLRFFRFGGVQRMVLSGVTAGFLLYVLSKITEDLGKADLMHPLVAAWSPALLGAVTGIVVLLHLEDG